jgi:hypothetical protein
MHLEKKIANKGLRTWAGSPRCGRGHTDGRNGVGDGKGGARLARSAKRGARTAAARLAFRDAG